MNTDQKVLIGSIWERDWIKGEVEIVSHVEYFAKRLTPAPADFGAHFIIYKFKGGYAAMPRKKFFESGFRMIRMAPKEEMPQSDTEEVMNEYGSW